MGAPHLCVLPWERRGGGGVPSTHGFLSPTEGGKRVCRTGVSGRSHTLSLRVFTRGDKGAGGGMGRRVKRLRLGLKLPTGAHELM